MNAAVQWRSGDLVLGNFTAGWDQVAPGPLAVPDAKFGIVRGYTNKGGGGLFLGLAKRRQARIRPTFLEQTRANRRKPSKLIDLLDVHESDTRVSPLSNAYLEISIENPSSLM